ncbi:[acyl-carrier-protein] S-malonyltransferase [Psittacicella melopsittaci]|uniref:Malonyl CoA-acyl carrier protein transacylase n=1 Tax=Psittacicella melopsittaci TaxID=2028576 RepID=A0A3A1XZJ5_9GAMM|nr:ACP S-malonyltransferase [Psittacicella melopsittaci]RIY31413.1 [acyl-carrier-protein] S-malonyltransferase [Psittacicella melopsittaci]
MKLAFIFPGQGSQSQGMLKDLAEKYPEVLDYFKQASDVLGYDLWDVVQNDPEKLSKTEVTQPALLTSSYAIFKVIEKEYPNLKPEYMAGHSLGEYSALTCAGVIDFKDAVKLVQLRGKYMQEAVPTGGAMYAILGLEDQVIIDTCAKVQAETGKVISAVNFNSPGQVVIAGDAQAAEQAANLLKEAGAKRAVQLAVSVPSHCSLMQPAADNMAKELEKITFHTAKVPVVHNTDLSVSTTKEEYIAALLKQLVGPVLWTQTVAKLADQDSVTNFLEVGPGKVLTGLSGRISKNASCQAVNTVASLEQLQELN